MDKIRMGFVGLGSRGSRMLSTFLSFPKVEAAAVCDVYEDRVMKVSADVLKKRGQTPRCYTDYSKMLSDGGLDAVYIASSWEEHINQAILSMSFHIPTAMEVGGAYSLKDCRRLVRAYEKTKTPFMLMENCCYDRFETLLTNLAKEDRFGEIVHCEGAYSHDLRKEITEGNLNRHYRLRNYISRNCENYPTHELGPIAKMLNINVGNRFVSLVSVASKSRGLEEYIRSGKCPDESLKDVHFKQGDIISTIITCENGETINLTLDTTLPGYYSRRLRLNGTKGCADQEADMILFDEDRIHYWDPRKTVTEYGGNASLYEDHLPNYWKTMTEEKEKSGHGGMDGFLVAVFLDALENGREMPIDVYDAACWYAITPLSAKSIKLGGKPLKIPDFTAGRYKTRSSKELFDNEKDYCPHFSR